MTPKYEGSFMVRRPFDVDGKRVTPGDIVDVTGWTNAYQLVDRGYLVATQGPITAFEGCPRCGATGEDPCVTSNGKATLRHAGRN